MSVDRAPKRRAAPGPSATKAALADQTYEPDVGAGFLFRWSTPDDVEQLVGMFANVMRSREDAPPHHRHANWVRDTVSRRCPPVSARDFALVEDTSTGQIVAPVCLSANHPARRSCCLSTES
jgi:hypothetical protein